MKSICPIVLQMQAVKGAFWNPFQRNGQVLFHRAAKLQIVFSVSLWPIKVHLIAYH